MGWLSYERCGPRERRASEVRLALLLAYPYQKRLESAKRSVRRRFLLQSLVARLRARSRCAAWRVPRGCATERIDVGRLEMRKMWAVVWLLGVVAVVSSGCSSDAASGTGTGTGAKLGETCNATTKCAEGECATAGFCTKDCAHHTDCGCAAGITDQDIADGACPLACTQGSCLKVCKTYQECGTASCNVTPSVYMACE